MKEILVGLVGAILSVTGVYSYSQYSQTFGALPVIQSAQLAANPSNGECLTTNGTVNDWATCGAGGGLSSYDAFTHPVAGVSATTTPIRFTGGLNASSTVLFDNATTTSLAILNLNSASCDVKASTSGVLSCGTDASGSGSGMATTSIDTESELETILTDVTNVFTNNDTIGTANGGTGISNPGALATAALLVFNDSSGATELTPGADGTILKSISGGSAFTMGSLDLADTDAVGTSILAIANGGTGWANIQSNAIPYGNGTTRLSTTTQGTAGQVLGLVGGVPTWVATSTCIQITGSADLCDGSDATGGGGSTPDSKWATSTDFAIYPSGVTNSAILGRTTQLGRDCFLCIFATSTTGDLIFASSTFNFDDNFVRFVDSAGATMFTVNSNGNADIAGNLEVTSDISSLTAINAPSYFLTGSGGFNLTNTAFGKLTLAAGGGTHDEALTIALDDAANTAVWSSSSGVTLIDWGAFNLTTTGTVTAGNLSVTNATSTTLNASGQVDFDGLTSALVLAGSTGILGEYAGASCTNQVVTALTAAGGATCTTLTSAYLDLTANYAWTGLHDFGGGTLEIPNGTAPTANDPGELAHDTTDNQLILDDFVVAKAVDTIWKVTVASTSPAFIEGGLLAIPLQLDGYTITAIRCYVSGGTSKVVAVEDASANSTEDITCATTATSDDGSITNATFTAAELGNIDFGATSGAVNYVTIAVFGTWTRE